MSPRTTAQNEEIRQERKDQIMQTALRLFAEKGYESTSISKIAKEAGIAKGLIYNYFESKEVLMEEIIYFAMRRVTGYLTITKNQDNPKETIKDLLYYLRDSLKNDFLFWKLYIRFGTQLSEKQEFLQKFMVEFQDWFNDMHSLLEKLGFRNPKLETLKFGAMTDGISTNYILMKDSYPLDQMIDYLVETYQNKDKL